MKKIYLNTIPTAWSGYPHAVVAGGFFFISSILALNEKGQLISQWDEFPQKEGRISSGFLGVDAVIAPVEAQASIIYNHLESLMASQGCSLKDLLRIHIYQKEKRFFPNFEKVRMLRESSDPAPSSGIGVCDSSPDGKAWITLDGIGIANKDWKFKSKREVLRSSGSLPETSYFSQAIEAGPYIFIAGQIPIQTTKPGKPVVKSFDDVPEEGRFLQVGRSHTDSRNGPIASQTWFVYNHIKNILEGAGSSIDDIINVTVFLQNMDDIATFHQIHCNIFKNHFPALTVTEFKQVGHKGSLIEIEVTALRSQHDIERRNVTTVNSLKQILHSAFAVIGGPLIFISGQAGIDETGKVINNLNGLPKDVWQHAEALSRMTGRWKVIFQVFRIFENLKLILAEAGLSIKSVARMVIYLKDFGDFPSIDAVSRYYFESDTPSIACVKIPRVHPVPGTLMAIEAIAVKE